MRRSTFSKSPGEIRGRPGRYSRSSSLQPVRDYKWPTQVPPLASLFVRSGQTVLDQITSLILAPLSRAPARVALVRLVSFRFASFRLAPLRFALVRLVP